MRKLIIIVTMVGVCFSMCSCSGSGANTTEENITAVEETNDKNNDDAAKVADNTNVVDDNTDEQSSITDDKEVITITKGDTVTMKKGTEEIEFTITNVAFENEVYSKSDNQFSQYFPDQDDESYIVIKANIKNISGDTVGYNFFDKTEVTFDNKYNYTLQHVDPESSILSSYWYIDPLKTYEVYFIQSVPDEVKPTGCNVSFTVGDTIYKY